MGKFVGVLAMISLFVIFLVNVYPSVTATGENSDFDFETGNSGVEVIIPKVIPAIYQSVSPTAADATLVLRITTIVTNS